MRLMNLIRKENVAPHNPDSLTIVAISDTHDLHREIEVPDGDLLIHAGDFTLFSRSARMLLDFNDWLGELPHPFRVVTPGNHDFAVEDPERRTLISNATLLVNESVEVLGLKIWGSPMTPLYGGAFGRSSEMERAKVYSRIPIDTDILVTHGPPFGILDCAPGADHHAGCHRLLEAVHRVTPMLHVFGHVHGGYGTLSTLGTLFVNAALPDAGFEMSNPPLSIKLPQRQ
jgi:Icc-related predicted phosphoesterase